MILSWIDKKKNENKNILALTTNLKKTNFRKFREFWAILRKLILEKNIK